MEVATPGEAMRERVVERVFLAFVALHGGFAEAEPVQTASSEAVAAETDGVVAVRAERAVEVQIVLDAGLVAAIAVNRGLDIGWGYGRYRRCRGCSLRNEASNWMWCWTIL